MTHANASKVESKSCKGRILLVDDERDIADSLGIGLRLNGYEVSIYNDPREAVKGFEPNSFDAAVIDIGMPGMNGFELYRRLRAADKKIKICFLTAFDMHGPEFNRVFPEVEISSFMTKPMSVSQFVQNVERVLAGKAPQSQVSGGS